MCYEPEHQKSRSLHWPLIGVCFIAVVVTGFWFVALSEVNKRKATIPKPPVEECVVLAETDLNFILDCRKGKQ